MDKPRKVSPGAVVGITFATLLGVTAIAVCVFFSLRFLRLRKRKRNSDVETRRSYSLPIRAHGINASMELSDSVVHHNHHHLHPYLLDLGPFSFWSNRSQDHSSLSPERRLTRFSYKQLQRATKNFTTLIGKGGFGPVYKAMLPNTAVVAVKVLATNSKQGEKEFQNEVLLLGRLHHRNLLHLVGYCVEGGHRILACDYMSNGSLDLRLHDERYPVLSWQQRVSIAQDVARGIEYLHNGAVPPVIHRDIKASNILLDSFMVARVADFGLSKEADPDMPASGVKGTYGYVDPEYVSTNSLTYKSDVYSFGVLLFELIAARSPLEGLMEYVELALLSNEGIEVWHQILDPRLKGDCDLKELAEMARIGTKCIHIEARKRPRMQEVVQAISRLGPRSESARIDFLDVSSIRRETSMVRAERVASRAASFQER
ncbi:hypothetical protein GOP47_0019874 [Adiantum capillus-veneris]|uniref:non-specific serine/threonine protein kinase n=1 Tax=Adiantum capillus-veneris TaxID=13818 RepID=A0A9D4UBW2_ADICA|nr:hypothetical protein GOP47_0019874 [Adiantum capillus-veneris]